MYRAMTKIFVNFYIQNGGMGNNSNYMLSWQIYFEKIFVNYPGSEMKTSKRKDLKFFESCQNMIITGIIRLTKTSWRRVWKDISSKLNESRDANNSVHPWTVQRFLHDRHVVQWGKMVKKITVNNYCNSVIFPDES